MLELLHPDGAATTSFVLGGNCPQDLLEESSNRAEQKIGLFILAPTARECRAEGWLENATEFVHQRLSDDGVCYVLVPPYWRWKAIGLLAQAGLVRDSTFWHFPDWTSSHYLVPLQPAPVQFATDVIIPAPSWKKGVAQKIFDFRAALHLLATFWKPVGISFRRPGAPPLFQWIFPGGQGTAIVRKSWRGPTGAEILYCFSKSDVRPTAIVKTASNGSTSARIEREAKALEVLGPGVLTAGARVPEILRRAQTSQRSSLFLSALPGRSAADLLASNAELLCPIFTKIVDWLKRWHATTQRVQPIKAELLERSIFTPMDQLAPFENRARYRNWLLKRVQAVSGTHVPLAAAHNDLTMANVLVDDQIGVVDWETGMRETWPLVDFYYAVTDAVRIAGRHATWLEAFKACYGPGGSFSHDVHCWEQQLRSALGGSARFSELCFHACWLHHASNEQKVTGPDDPKPFLQIVQYLAVSCGPSTGNRNLENAKETDPEKNSSNCGGRTLPADAQRVATDSKC